LLALRMRLTVVLVLTTLGFLAEANPRPKPDPLTVKAHVAVKVEAGAMPRKGGPVSRKIIGSGFNQWGWWGGFSMCQNNEPAIGFVVRHQVQWKPDGTWKYCSAAWCFDNTGINSICLVCKGMVTSCSSQGPWGGWHTPFRDERLNFLFPGIEMPINEVPLCDKGLTQLYMENQKPQGIWDDMGLYYVGMHCGNGPDSHMLKPAGVWGGAGDHHGHYKVPGIENRHWKCEEGYAICGISTLNYNWAKRRVRREASAGILNSTEGLKSGNRSIEDDTSLSGALFKCCKIKP